MFSPNNSAKKSASTLIPLNVAGFDNRSLNYHQRLDPSRYERRFEASRQILALNLSQQSEFVFRENAVPVTYYVRSAHLVQSPGAVLMMQPLSQTNLGPEAQPAPLNYSMHSPDENRKRFTNPSPTLSDHLRVACRESEPTPRNQRIEICQVCGCTASKHQAYGGKVCHSCRAFFRRSVQTKYFEIFSCAGNEVCDINISTRKSCKYCRFKKCLEAKMQISWVLSEQERERRFNKLKKVTFRNNLTSTRSESPTTCLTTLSVPLHKTPEIHFTVEEQMRLENLRDYVKGMAVPRYEYFFNCEPECLVHLAHASYFGGPLNYDLWKRFTNASDLFHQEMFLNLDGMRELPRSDGLSLMRSNGLASYSYLEAVYADEEDSGLSQDLKAATLSGELPSMRNLLDILQRLGMTGKNPIIKYDQIYVSRWGATLEDESRHRTLLYKMKGFARPHGSSYGSSDQILTALMRIIIAFYPDSVQTLLNKEECDKIIHQYCMLLHRYIKKNYGHQANAKFAQAMATCVNAREAAEILQRRIN